MNKFFPVLLFICSLAACKKDGGNSPAPVNPSGNRNYSVLRNYEYINGIWTRKGYMFLDLDHAANKDKKFLVVDIENNPAGGYKFVLKKGPLPIDSLATNWPPEVRRVAFGYSNDIIIDAHMRLLTQSFDNGRFVYRYDSLYKFPSAGLTYNYLNNATLYAGNMAGKAPQGRAFFWTPDGSGYSKPNDIIYYFKEGFFTNVIGVGNGAQPLTTLVNGIPTLTDDWKKVDAVMTIEGLNYTTFYFDFDSWQYFSVRDFCQSVNGGLCTGSIQYADYISMNNLMTWPAGWGKP